MDYMIGEKVSNNITGDNAKEYIDKLIRGMGYTKVIGRNEYIHDESSVRVFNTDYGCDILSINKREAGERRIKVREHRMFDKQILKNLTVYKILSQIDDSEYVDKGLFEWELEQHGWIRDQAETKFGYTYTKEDSWANIYGHTVTIEVGKCEKWDLKTTSSGLEILKVVLARLDKKCKLHDILS